MRRTWLVVMVTARTVLLSQAHVAIAECECRLKEQGRRVVVITQNIDGLHARAGSDNIVELHGVVSPVLILSS